MTSGPLTWGSNTTQSLCPSVISPQTASDCLQGLGSLVPFTKVSLVDIGRPWPCWPECGTEERAERSGRSAPRRGAL